MEVPATGQPHFLWSSSLASSFCCCWPALGRAMQRGRGARLTPDPSWSWRPPHHPRRRRHPNPSSPRSDRRPPASGSTASNAKHGTTCRGSLTRTSGTPTPRLASSASRARTVALVPRSTPRNSTPSWRHRMRGFQIQKLD